MTENEIATIVLDACFAIHKKLGPGLLESVYEKILAFELEHTYHLQVITQKEVPVIWKNMKMDISFRADIIVEDKVIIELKAVETIHDVYYKQLLTYLKVTDLKLGILVNFNEVLLKNGIKRIVNNL